MEPEDAMTADINRLLDEYRHAIEARIASPASDYMREDEQHARAAIIAAWEGREALPPIERDEAYDRTYIPLPGGWEVQTKGKGSTFRICDTKSGDRWPVLESHLHAYLERMAREVRAAYEARTEGKGNG
jgi:hypothetical protein